MCVGVWHKGRFQEFELELLEGEKYLIEGVKEVSIDAVLVEEQNTEFVQGDLARLNFRKVVKSVMSSLRSICTHVMADDRW